MSLSKDRHSATAGADYFSAYAKRRNVARSHYFTRAFPAYADARLRLLATAFDLILVGLLVVASIALSMQDSMLLGLDALWSVDVLLLLICIPMLYFVVFWSLFSASPGKMLLSLRVVDATTQGEVSGLQCLLRYLGYVVNVLSLGLGAVGIFNNRKPLGWHDRFAGTMVIRQ